MQRRHSLRLRVAAALALFGGLVSLLLAAGLYLAAHDVGQRLIDETLRAELDDYMARRQRNPQSLPPASVTLRGYVDSPAAPNADIPAEVRTLSPGRHEIELDGVPYRVAVADEQELRFFLLFNETRQQAREQRFIAYLAGGTVTMILLSAAIGLWFAGRVIAPVTDLARQVGAADPAAPPPLLADEDAPHDEVGDLARIFQGYLRRLHDFIDRERAFTADVSHELRTPLAVVQGAAEVLQSDERLDAEQRGRLARIERAARDMTDLIRALLLMAREAEPEPDSQCDAAEVVLDCIERYRHLLGRHNATYNVEIDASPLLPAEPTLFSIVVSNLVRNAFTYTEAGRVDIRLTAGRLEVRDTGIGIRAEEIGRVFQRYYKGAASQGSGIGLSLVKRVCDRYGWSIAIESVEGRGTCAMLTFLTQP